MDHADSNIVMTSRCDLALAVAQVRSGRELLMHERREVLRSVLPALRSANPIRRLGVLKAVRNCCYDRHRHAFLVAEPLGLVDALLERIIGSEPIPPEVLASNIMHLMFTFRFRPSVPL